mgnify:FL=1
MSIENLTPSTQPEKSQAELRTILESRITSSISTLDTDIEAYQQALKDGLFDDKEEEEEGVGEQRRATMQKRLTSQIEQAEKLKELLDSGQELPQSQPDLSTSYTRPDGRVETITLNLESKLQEFIDLYAQTNINLPPNFKDTIRSIWNNNQVEIEKAIQQQGFNELLILPGNIPLPELKDKMSMENGYLEGSNFTSGGSFASAKSPNVTKARIVLVHNAQDLQDRQELAQTLNIKGQDVKLDQALSLEDYIVFQRYYFEKTGKHLDEVNYTWLNTKSGACLVHSIWSPDDGILYVRASDPDDRASHLGSRLSRCFEDK